MTLVPSNVRRAVKIGFAELDRDRARLACQIESFLAKMERNPISALNLRYVVRKGIVGDPFEIKGKWVSMKVNLELRDASKLQTKWVPRKYQEGDTPGSRGRRNSTVLKGVFCAPDSTGQ